MCIIGVERKFFRVYAKSRKTVPEAPRRSSSTAITTHDRLLRLLDRMEPAGTEEEGPASCVVGTEVSPGVTQSGSPYGKGGMVLLFLLSFSSSSRSLAHNKQRGDEGEVGRYTRTNTPVFEKSVTDNCERE